MLRDRSYRLAITFVLALALLLVSVPLEQSGASAASTASQAGWLRTGPMPVAITDQSRPVLLHDGRVFVLAQFAGDSMKVQGELYDPVTNAWSMTSVTDISSGIDSPVVLENGDVLLWGGIYNSGKSPDDVRIVPGCQTYSPASNLWHPVAPLRQTRVDSTAALLSDGSVLLTGGYEWPGGPADTERYDPRSNTWTVVSPPSERGLSDEIVRLQDGRILTVGAATDSKGELHPSARIFDLKRNGWSEVTPPERLHGQGTATVLPNGNVLLVGGISSPYPYTVSSSTEIYNPATDRWIAGPSMAATRYNQAAVLLQNGTVLVAGGGDFPASQQSAEIYDPAPDAWQSAPTPPISTRYPSAVLLDDGSVLILSRTGEAERYFSELPTPTERQLPPGGPLPASRVYFSETGHYLADGFLAYWQHFGGLPIFGYPISEEFQQNGVTVQYFERARFEWHPGSDPARYDVELGLLGDQAAQAQGLLGTLPFQPIQAASDQNCAFDAVTDHRFCFGFRAYWQSHGGLAIFGRPISEEFRDPTTGLTVQYFKRAVFEYHPNNPVPYQVLLRRLGADALARQ